MTAVARLPTGLFVVLIAMASVTGCDSAQTYPLRTDARVHSVPLCQNGAALPSVSGALDGDVTATPDYVWLDNADTRTYLVWPSGFRVRFEPTMQVLDEAGAVVAGQGDMIALPQVADIAGAGTKDNPYRVTGQLGSRCYEPTG